MDFDNCFRRNKKRNNVKRGKQKQSNFDRPKNVSICFNTNKFITANDLLLYMKQTNSRQSINAFFSRLYSVF